MHNGKALIIIGDGMGDRPVPELNGKTPLEVAKTPNMDRLAAEGISGLMDPIAPGIRAGSDTAHLAILGYNPYEYYTGRGPFEAAGIGMDVKHGDVSFRCNFSTVDENMTVLDRRAGRITEGTHDLAKAVDGMKIEDVTVFFKESIAHRGALVLRGPGLGAKISDTDPHTEGAKVLISKAEDENDAESVKTARIVNEFVKRSYELLKDHPVNKERIAKGENPANIILPRGVGFAPKMKSFDETHNAKSACIVEVGLVKGIGKYLGMDVIDVDGATGGMDSNIMAIGEAVVKAFKDHNFILCNVKGTDVGGHDGTAEGKIKIIEEIDEMLGYLLKNLDGNTNIAVTADHATPITFKDHSGDPVPIVFWGPGVLSDDVTKFSERAAMKGGIQRICGMDVTNILTQLMGIQTKFGA